MVSGLIWSKKDIYLCAKINLSKSIVKGYGKY